MTEKGKKWQKGKIFENLGKNVQNLQIFWGRAGDCTQQKRLCISSIYLSIAIPNEGVGEVGKFWCFWRIRGPKGGLAHIDIYDQGAWSKGSCFWPKGRSCFFFRVLYHRGNDTKNIQEFRKNISKSWVIKKILISVPKMSQME